MTLRQCVLGLALVLGLLPACSTTTSQLKSRFAKERRCPETQVAVSERGGAVYLARGCGAETEYICGSFAGFDSAKDRCRERGLNPHEPSGYPPPQNTSRPDLVAPK